MDLVNTVRKEGSRGGRADFKWTDVQADQHRENYLGHSLMAPVGRWQKGKDLQWYSRNTNTTGDDNDGLTEEERARKERQEEIARIKQAEREAMNKALGYGVNPDGPLGDAKGATGANATTVIGNKAGRGPDTENGDNIGHKHRRKNREKDSEQRHRRRRDHSRSRSRDRQYKRNLRRRSTSRSRDKPRNHDGSDELRREQLYDERHHRRRSRSPRRRQRLRSVSRDRSLEKRNRQRSRSNSRSPYQRPASRSRELWIGKPGCRRGRSRSP